MLRIPHFNYHNKMAPHIWGRNEDMSPLARMALMAIFNQVLGAFRDINIPLDASDVHDVFVHGSITNFYYNKSSDIDLCFVCDFSRMNKELPNQNKLLLLKSIVHSVMLETQPRIFGRSIDIEFVDVRHQQYGKNRYKVGGCYSVLRNKWVHKTVRLNKRAIRQLKQDAKRIYRDMRPQVFEALLENSNFSRVEELTNTLMRHRKSAYASSPEQPITPYVIAYRMLKESGLLAKAYEHALKLRATGKKIV